MINAHLMLVCCIQNYPEDMMENFTCTINGQVYNPKKVKSLQNIPPGRDYFTLPDDRQCPICGASKQNFNKE
jgi:rubredoxin